MENIVLQDERKEHIKIVDFGLSNIYASDDPLRTHCGSPEYAAPELFVVGKRYGPEVDLWSLGVVLYGMTTGRLPFLCPRDEWTSSEERRRRLMIQINRGLTATQERAMCQSSNDCRNLINRLLVPSACERITIREILDHPWLLGPSKGNFHLCSEGDLNVSDRLAIVNDIATLMETSAVTVEAEIMRRKYGEIGGMYNIKVHELHQRASIVNRLGSRAFRISTYQTEDASSSNVTVRTIKDNCRKGASRKSDNTDCMRHDQMQDRSVKKFSLHGSTTWNWRCRSGNGNRSSEERRNPRIRFDMPNLNTFLSSKQCHSLQIKKGQGDKSSDHEQYRSNMSGDGVYQTGVKNYMYCANSKRTEKDRTVFRNFRVNCEILPNPTSRVGSMSMSTSRIKENFHGKILTYPRRYQVTSARLKGDT